MQLDAMQNNASNDVLCPMQFGLNAKVFDIGHREVILGLSWLQENGFSVDVLNSHLINSSNGIDIPCTSRKILTITLFSIHNDFELEEGEILLIFNARERYSHYARVFSQEFAARLPSYTKWDHQIPLKDPNAKVPGGRVVYKTMWEEKEALAQYLKEHLPTGKVCRSHSVASSPILF